MIKATVEEIRARFDADVERFSSLDTGQATTIDAPLVLDLIAEAARATTPHATHLLDIGCGAGNYALRLLQEVPNLNVDLVDLSQPMLDRARQRVGDATDGEVRTIQADIRQLAPQVGVSQLATERYDVVVTAAALHHLRTEAEWEAVFRSVYQSLRAGGSFWLSDLITHDIEAVRAMMWRRYGEYLTGLKDEVYRDHVFAYIAKEDSPRSLPFQLDLLRRVGFRQLDVLHKTSVFAAFGGVK
ncbi:MAG: class I SAM-dependent methyltransferase [Rubricoccaceae bacterium]